MLAALVLLAQVVATPAAAPTPTGEPVSAASNGRTRTLADVARERKLGKKGVVGGTLTVAGAPVERAPAGPGGAPVDTAREADARLARAIEHGAWVDRNIHYNEQIKRDARYEWDAAAEACRQTPGCTPVYRDSVDLGGHKPLRTGDEVNRDAKKRLGGSVDVTTR
jgi:hypothetical protein